MGEQQKRGDDAADHAPRPKAGDPTPGGPRPDAGAEKQDAPNYDDLEDGGRAVPLKDMNSANDE